MIGGGAPNVRTMINFLLILMAPKLAYYLKTPALGATTVQFFDQVIRQNIKDRKASQTKQNDFIDLLGEAIQDLEKKGNKFVSSEEELEDIIIA